MYSRNRRWYGNGDTLDKQSYARYNFIMDIVAKSTIGGVRQGKEEELIL